MGPCNYGVIIGDAPSLILGLHLWLLGIAKKLVPGEEHDKSHLLHTRVVYWSMLFPLVWTETDTPEDKDNDRGFPNHQACALKGEAGKK